MSSFTDSSEISNRKYHYFFLHEILVNKHLSTQYQGYFDKPQWFFNHFNLTYVIGSNQVVIFCHTSVAKPDSVVRKSYSAEKKPVNEIEND